MKKNYFMLAAATMMFAACAETDLVNEVNMEEAPKAIEFESFANKTTRAEITGLTNLQTAGFQVWGYKYPSDATIVWEDVYSEVEEDETPELVTKANYFTVFNGVDVSGATWTYTGTQYWDENSKYNFYAVAPMAPKDGVTYDIDKGNIIIEGASSAKSTASDDYLIATAVTGQNGSDKGTVNFNFSHIMSKISFKLVAGIEEEIEVTSLKMSGWNVGTGTYTQGNNSEWAITGNTTGALFLVGTDDATDETITLTTNAPEVAVQDAYIMVPQTITYVPYEAEVKNDSGETITAEVPESGLTFTISYKIGEEVFTNQVGIVTSDQIWAKNTHTTYTITVSPAEIKFNVATNHNFGWGDDETGSATIQ